MIHELQSATTALAEASRSVAYPAEVSQMVDALDDLASAFRGAAGACDALARHAVPDGAAGPISGRYRAAADAWPSDTPPSYDRLAAVLASLHDTAATARMAARRCEAAVAAVAATGGRR